MWNPLRNRQQRGFIENEVYYNSEKMPYPQRPNTPCLEFELGFARLYDLTLAPTTPKYEHGICIIKFGLRPSSMAYVLPEKNDVLEWHFTKYTFMKIKQGNKILLQKGMFLH
jgi:hypothetical protein